MILILNASYARAPLLVLAFLTTGLSACTAPKSDRDTLAAQGMIDDTAPVKATAQIIIQAPPAKIWGLLDGHQGLADVATRYI